MNNVNRTLYIPLYGKSYVSRRGIILSDPRAEEIWQAEGFSLRGKSRSKWLAFYMGMRSAVFDKWTANQLSGDNSTIVLHIGCGMDSRCQRVDIPDGVLWYDIDFPEVAAERRRYFSENEQYHILSADVRTGEWLDTLPGERTAVVIMEGVSMYMSPEELTALLGRLTGHFASVRLLVDCYSSLAARASRYKNPINDVGVTRVYGIDQPEALESGTGLSFAAEHSMTPDEMIAQLSGSEQGIFRRLYAGRMAIKLYRLYEYTTK